MLSVAPCSMRLFRLLVGHCLSDWLTDCNLTHYLQKHQHLCIDRYLKRAGRRQVVFPQLVEQVAKSHSSVDACNEQAGQCRHCCWVTDVAHQLLRSVFILFFSYLVACIMSYSSPQNELAGGSFFLNFQNRLRKVTNLLMLVTRKLHQRKLGNAGTAVG